MSRPSGAARGRNAGHAGRCRSRPARSPRLLLHSGNVSADHRCSVAIEVRGDLPGVEETCRAILTPVQSWSAPAPTVTIASSATTGRSGQVSSPSCSVADRSRPRVSRHAASGTRTRRPAPPTCGFISSLDPESSRESSRSMTAALRSKAPSCVRNSLRRFDCRRRTRQSLPGLIRTTGRYVPQGRRFAGGRRSRVEAAGHGGPPVLRQYRHACHRLLEHERRRDDDRREGIRSGALPCAASCCRVPGGAERRFAAQPRLTRRLGQSPRFAAGLSVVPCSKRPSQLCLAGGRSKTVFRQSTGPSDAVGSRRPRNSHFARESLREADEWIDDRIGATSHKCTGSDEPRKRPAPQPLSSRQLTWRKPSDTS